MPDKTNQGKDLFQSKDELKFVLDCNSEKIIRIDKSDCLYPMDLLALKPQPEALYCIGNVDLLKKRKISVVGSRKCSEYGRQVAKKIGSAAALNDFVLVSGMAKGIDTYGHVGALNADGSTIAVLGCGPDVCYPRQNLTLFQQICEKGLIVSEYLPGTEPLPYRFPQRNRIIAALSEATVVVEAGIDSGSLITADIANSLGKTVFAVPGNITNIQSLGSNRLICDGAQAISVIDDIFYGIGIQPAIGKETIDSLGTDELEILEFIKNNGETTYDKIAAFTGNDIYKVIGIVSVLEIKGLVAESIGKIFSCQT